MNLTFDNNCDQLKPDASYKEKLTQWHPTRSGKLSIKKVLQWFPRQSTVKAKSAGNK